MNQQTLGHLAALFTIVNWGTTFIGTKVMHINPIRMIVYAAVAGLLLLY